MAEPQRVVDQARLRGVPKPADALVHRGASSARGREVPGQWSSRCGGISLGATTGRVLSEIGNFSYHKRPATRRETKASSLENLSCVSAGCCR